jgi:uncharacterized protein YndB with AHSA1/START domain
LLSSSNLLAPNLHLKTPTIYQNMAASWPPANGLSTPTVSREEATFAISSSKLINAPASLVFEILCDTPKYPEWNSFCPKVTIHSQPADTPSDSSTLVKGTSFTFHVVMDNSKPNKETPTQLVVTDISTPHKPSSYIPTDVLEKDATYTSDLQLVYRISWKSEGGFVSRGLRTERFHEIIVKGDSECEVRTWEVMGGILASTVKWFFKDNLTQKFWIWCEDLKKFSEERV